MQQVNIPTDLHSEVKLLDNLNQFLQYAMGNCMSRTLQAAGVDINNVLEARINTDPDGTLIVQYNLNDSDNQLTVQ